jgi:hypothetical protein
MVASGSAVAAGGDGNQLIKHCTVAVKAVDGAKVDGYYDVGYCLGLTQGVRQTMKIQNEGLPATSQVSSRTSTFFSSCLHFSGGPLDDVIGILAEANRAYWYLLADQRVVNSGFGFGPLYLTNESLSGLMVISLTFAFRTFK